MLALPTRCFMAITILTVSYSICNKLITFFFPKPQEKLVMRNNIRVFPILVVNHARLHFQIFRINLILVLNLTRLDELD